MSIILGTLNFDYDYKSGEIDVSAFLRACLDKGVNVIDTASYYNRAEEYLGMCPELNQMKVNSKANPWKDNDFRSGILGQLSEHGIRRQLETSLKNLRLSSLDTYFLHAWDYSTPIYETLATFDTLHRQEKFRKFGVCNVSSDQLTKILKICELEKLTPPLVYQGMYNVYCRKIEELFPLLADYNMQFQAYNPLAGGILTGKYTTGTVSGGRFDGNEIYKSIFWNDTVVKYAGSLTADVSLRWLKQQPGVDSVIIGCSTLKHLQDNISYLHCDTPLQSHEQDVIDTFYKNTHCFSPNYYY
ncbi:aldo/keto reductase [bacterium]|nr:aldo/keto reductase [bacterium]NDC94390.1 aldo/keto reductase [bacterium]NDD83931.1 aldo/keto reductase [bacterium]NDG29826.1 aldo/keto reductase [bacterium]